MEKLEIDLNLKKMITLVVVMCFFFEFMILLLDVLFNMAQLWHFEKFRELSDTALEKSFGTWFSVAQNAVVALTALVICFHYRYVSPHKRRFLAWLVVCLFFAYISLDDHLVLHERVSGELGALIFRNLLGKNVHFSTYKWIYLFAPVFAAFGLFFLIFLYTQFDRPGHKWILVLALGVWAMAVGLDAWEGAGLPYEGIGGITGLQRVKIRHGFMLIEEMLEMIGSTLFLYLFLSHIQALYTKKQTLFRILQRTCK